MGIPESAKDSQIGKELQALALEKAEEKKEEAKEAAAEMARKGSESAIDIAGQKMDAIAKSPQAQAAGAAAASAAGGAAKKHFDKPKEDTEESKAIEEQKDDLSVKSSLPTRKLVETDMEVLSVASPRDLPPIQSPTGAAMVAPTTAPKSNPSGPPHTKRPTMRIAAVSGSPPVGLADEASPPAPAAAPASDDIQG